MKQHLCRARRPDPFAWCRRHRIQVIPIAGARRWITGILLGEPFVIVNPRLSPAEQRRAVAEALVAHPTFVPHVSSN